jgi:hypothetical protein
VTTYTVEPSGLKNASCTTFSAVVLSPASISANLISPTACSL